MNPVNTDPRGRTWLYCVRHAENVANLTGELSHRVVDHPLTDRGVEQARRLTAFLREGDGVADPVYTSPLRRATQTAEILAAGLALTLDVVEDFRELNVGELDGRSDHEAWAAYNEVVRAWHSGRRDVAFPGGENHHEMVARVRRGLSTVLRQSGGGAPVVVVAHGGIVRAAVTACCPGAVVPSYDMANCAVTELDVTAGATGPEGWLVAWSRTEFLASA